VITKKELEAIAKLFGRKPWQQEKHYIQTLILIALADEPLVFIGGTYLWFFHGLDRFSEDLDFTINGTISPNLLENVSQSLQYLGVVNKVKLAQPAHDTYSFRVSAEGPLHSSPNDLCYVYVDISQREKVILKPIPCTLHTNPYLTPIKTISGMDLSEIASEKIRAIMSREKARDIYDLFYLFQQGAKPTIEMIEEKLSYYNLPYTQSAWDDAISKKESLWVKELQPFVQNKLMSFESAVESINKKLLDTIPFTI
jgi:predicted nucleotidyltransferase component of viral defense system